MRCLPLYFFIGFGCSELSPNQDFFSQAACARDTPIAPENPFDERLLDEATQLLTSRNSYAGTLTRRNIIDHPREHVLGFYTRFGDIVWKSPQGISDEPYTLSQRAAAFYKFDRNVLKLGVVVPTRALRTGFERRPGYITPYVPNDKQKLKDLAQDESWLPDSMIKLAVIDFILNYQDRSTSRGDDAFLKNTRYYKDILVPIDNDRSVDPIAEEGLSSLAAERAIRHNAALPKDVDIQLKYLSQDPEGIRMLQSWVDHHAREFVSRKDIELFRCIITNKISLLATSGFQVRDLMGQHDIETWLSQLRNACLIEVAPNF